MCCWRFLADLEKHKPLETLNVQGLNKLDDAHQFSGIFEVGKLGFEYGFSVVDLSRFERGIYECLNGLADGGGRIAHITERFQIHTGDHRIVHDAETTPKKGVQQFEFDAG